MQIFVYRYTFTIAANVLVFSCFWILLEKINHDADTANLTPGDKEIFWVKHLRCCWPCITIDSLLCANNKPKVYTLNLTFLVMNKQEGCLIVNKDNINYVPTVIGNFNFTYVACYYSVYIVSCMMFDEA